MQRARPRAEASRRVDLVQRAGILGCPRAAGLDWTALLWTLLGTGLAAGAANGLNQLIEMRRDGLIGAVGESSGLDIPSALPSRCQRNLGDSQTQVASAPQVMPSTGESEAREDGQVGLGRPQVAGSVAGKALDIKRNEIVGKRG